MLNERDGMGVPASSATPSLTVERLGNANRVFLTKRKDRRSSSAAGLPPKVVKTERRSSVEAFRDPQVPQATPGVDEAEDAQPTVARPWKSTSRPCSPLFISVEENSRREPRSPTGPSSPGVSSRLATVALASNMGFECEFEFPQSPEDVCSCS